MKQTIFTIAIVLIIAGLLSAVIIGSRGKKADTQATLPSTSSSSAAPASDNQTPIFFFGNTCPHCADVEKWMEENKIEEKIQLIKKEVYDNKANALELSKAAESCGMDTSSIGVPFLFTPEGKCLVGTPDIINYLSQKAGLSGKEAEQ